MSLKYSEIVRILRDYGFVLDRQNGSHQMYKKNDQGVVVGYGKEYPPKTAKSMIKTIAEIQGISPKEIMKEYSIKL